MDNTESKEPVYFFWCGEDAENIKTDSAEPIWGGAITKGQEPNENERIDVC